MPQFEGLEVYQCYHALLLLAGQLLKTHEVQKSGLNRVDDFTEWFERYKLACADGSWPADHRDPDFFPPPIYTQALTKPYCPVVHPEQVEALMITEGKRVVLYGDWVSHSGHAHQEYIRISSALFPKEQSSAFLNAARNAENTHRFCCPVAEETEYWPNSIETGYHEDDHRKGFQATPWLYVNFLEFQLEEYDPWGRRVHCPRPQPIDKVKQVLALQPQTNGRSWVAANHGQLYSETWVSERYEYGDVDYVPGCRLSGCTSLLKGLIDKFPDHDLIVKLRIFWGGNCYDYHMPDGRPADHVQYFIVSHEGKLVTHPIT